MTFELVEANTEPSALQMTPNVTLTSAITSSQASFTYTSAGDPIGPPSGASLGGQTRAEIEIDSEQILVTNINQTSNTYSGLIRGWNGTTPAAHNAGAQIRKVNVTLAIRSDKRSAETGYYHNTLFTQVALRNLAHQPST